MREVPKQIWLVDASAPLWPRPIGNYYDLLSEATRDGGRGGEGAEHFVCHMQFLALLKARLPKSVSGVC